MASARGAAIRARPIATICLFAARRSARRTFAELVQLRQQLVQALETVTNLAAAAEIAERRGDDLGAEGAAVGAEQEVRLDREGGEHLPSLGHLGQPSRDDPARRPARHIAATDADVPTRGDEDAAGSVQQRALTRTVRADQRDTLARVDVQRDAVDRDGGAVADDDVLELEQRGHMVAVPR